MKAQILKSALNSVGTKLFVTQVLVAACALLANILSARTLGPEARGELGLFMQIAYVANIISVLGRHRSYLRLESNGAVSLATSFRDIRRLSFTPLLLSFLIALTFTIVLNFYNYSLTLFLGIGFFALVYSGVQQKTFRSGAIIARNATPYFWSSLTGQTLMLLSVSYLTYSNNTNLAFWLSAYGASVLFPYTVLGILVTLKNSEPESKDAELEKVKRLGIRLVPLSVAEIMGSRLDRFLIPILASFSQLGIYTVVVTMTELIAWPINNYADSKVPKWARDISRGKLNLLKEVTWIILSISLLGITVGFSLEWALIPLFGEEYLSGIQLIWPLVIAAALHSFNHVGTNLCIAGGLNLLANAIPISSMVFAGIFHLFLIAPYGALGAAWGLVIGYLAGAGMTVIGIVKISRTQQLLTNQDFQ
ncbi:hypothetical protein FM102_11100 [Corynebacterium glutamicum]|uniref:lipopolysaccharide biosynthesis protein n=1 Tax=Corynebacterium glutamicum TaxID=1718 RepID=UPI00097ED25D|nr:hypothetical protein [Corynebacterium glutamicum]SJM65966.1 hypothetical protein FM102_11100 [Corynebacterium glutamicum]